MKISVNDQIVDEQEAVVSVYDHGFLYGLGLFETFRTYRGVPFLLQEHLARLEQGCEELGIEFKPDETRLRKQLNKLLHVNELQDAYIRYTVSAGVDLLGLPGGAYTKPTEIIYMKPLPPRDPFIEKHGRSLQLLKHPRNTPEGLYRLKSFHYMNNILAKKELQSYSWAAGAEGLMLTEEGFLAEGIVSNVMFVKESTCYTPSLDTGVLPGITRAHILQVAGSCGLSVQEGLYTWEDLLSADEVFIVNSIQELVPITRLYTPDGEDFLIHDGVPGEYTRRLFKHYQEATGSGL
jgi:4-amino-4-deoxychorismate lyase